MYTFRFYSATHRGNVRAAAERAIDGGLPVFVTEFGITAASGDHPRGIDEADAWIEMPESRHVSRCMWSLSKVAEESACIRPTVPKYCGFEEEDYTPTGLWLLETLKKHTGR